jgi:hypothetical protein
LGCALEDFKERLKDSDTTWHLVLGSDCALGGRKAAIDNAVCIITDWFNNVAMPPPPTPLQKLKSCSSRTNKPPGGNLKKNLSFPKP